MPKQEGPKKVAIAVLRFKERLAHDATPQEVLDEMKSRLGDRYEEAERDWRRRNPSVRAFAQCFVEMTGGAAIVTVPDEEQHIFHSSDVESISIEPTKIEVVE